jgi:hypothetical protein
MKETISLFQFQTDAPYEGFMADRPASREVSHHTVRIALGDEILEGPDSLQPMLLRFYEWASTG